MEKIDTGKVFGFILKALRSFSQHSFYHHSPGALLGTARTEARRRRKFIKYLKVQKRLLSPTAINFHLHFIFVSFATLESGTVHERTMGAGEKKQQKEKERCKVTEMPEGNIVERPTMDDDLASLSLPIYLSISLSFRDQNKLFLLRLRNY